MSDYLPPLSKDALEFQPGLYKHYKGGTYRAWFVGRSSEKRDDEFVVYQSLEKGFVWIRPLAMFTEDVTVDGETRPRFRKIGV